MADKAASSDAQNPFQLTIREFLSCWNVVRRTPAKIDQIETELAELGFTTRPPFTDGWIDSKVAIVPISVEPGEGGLSSEGEPAEDTKELEESPEIRLRVGVLKSANTRVAFVQPGDTLEIATTQMVADNYSQLAVIGDDGELLGAVSWESIGKANISRSARHVADVMIQAKPVDHHEDLLDQIGEIFRRGYVFVRGSERKISGIITAADLTVQFNDLVRPFVLVEEAERRLRRWADDTFSLEEIQNVVPRHRAHEVTSSADLTFGNYKRLLEPPQNWKQLGWPLHQELFMTRLEAVRGIRNDLMHFHPDPLDDDQMRCLESFVRMLRTVDPRG